MFYLCASLLCKFQITLAPALAKKPQGDDNKEKTSPFINPNPDLLVKELDEHLLLLNKFAVIPNHMLVVTKGKCFFLCVLELKLNYFLNRAKESD